MKQGDILAPTETVVDYSRFKRGFQRFDTLLEKLAEGGKKVQCSLKWSIVMLVNSTPQLSEDLLICSSMIGAASTLWAITEGEEMQNLHETFFCALRKDESAEKIMKEHKKKSIAWGATTTVASAVAFYSLVLIIGGPIAASVIGTSYTTTFGFPMASYVVGTGWTAGTAVVGAAAGGGAMISDEKRLAHAARRADCMDSCNQSKFVGRLTTSFNLLTVTAVNMLHASFQNAFQNVLRILLIRLAKNLEVSHFCHNGDPALRSHFLEAFGIDLEELKREEYSIQYLGQEQRRLREEFNSLTGEIDKFSKGHGLGLPHK